MFGFDVAWGAVCVPCFGRGRVKMNSSPPPRRRRTVMEPPIVFMLLFTMDNPSPVPPAFLERPVSTL